MRLLARGALRQPVTVGTQTLNFVIAAVLYYVAAAIPVVAKMASEGQLQLPKTLTLWLVGLSPFVVAILGVIVAVLRGEPIPQPPVSPAP